MRAKIAMLLMCTAGAARAAEWVPVTASKTANVYVDKASVSRTGDRAQMWVKFVMDPPEPIPDSKRMITHSMALLRVNCKERSSLSVQGSMYDSEGTPLNRETRRDVPGNYSMAAPDTLNDDLVTFACTFKRK